MNSLDSLRETIPDAAHPVLSAIWAAQSRYELLPLPMHRGSTYSPVVVGLSGGPDSVCLLHALCLLAPHWDLALNAAHVDHRLRAGSAGDAEFAADFAGRLGVPFNLHRLDDQSLHDDARGLEAAARVARYAYLAQLARELAFGSVSAPTVAVAHHMDDQAETVLMNLLRGAGLRGLGGMPWVRVLDATEADAGATAHAPDVRLVRPLLHVRRTQVMDYLHAFGLSYREDPTNQDVAHLRNRVRHETLPTLANLNPQIVATLARTADLLAPEAERTESLDRSALASVTVNAEPPHRYVLDLEVFTRLALAAQRGVLRLACEQMALDARDLGFDTLEELIWQLHDGAYTRGPHTLAQDAMWTVLSETAARPALLSIHARGVLPWRPHHPLLTDLRPHIHLPHPLAAPGVYQFSEDWRLRCRILAVDELPLHWRTNRDPWRAFLDAGRVRCARTDRPFGRNALLASRHVRQAQEPRRLLHRSQDSTVPAHALARHNRPTPRFPIHLPRHLGVWPRHRPRRAHHRRYPPRPLPGMATRPSVGRAPDGRDPMRANVKPFTYWLIHNRYTARFSHRSQESVRGVVTTPGGEQEFDYNPATLTIRLPDRIVTITRHGWETEPPTTGDTVTGDKEADNKMSNATKSSNEHEGSPANDR